MNKLKIQEERKSKNKDVYIQKESRKKEDRIPWGWKKIPPSFGDSPAQKSEGRNNENME
ncbi:hypothetical protein HOG48_04195 [Candidatus Peregrinibacteria bacterium]|nr:hypothetical protein [Candidatus Peregrinibacteria bacterium]